MRMTPRTFGQLEVGNTIMWLDAVDAMCFLVVRKLWDTDGEPMLTFLHLRDGKLLTQTLACDHRLDGYDVFVAEGT